MPSSRVISVSASVAAVTLALVSRSYEDNTAQWKQDFLWSRILEDTSGDQYMNPIKTLFQVSHKAYLMAMTNTHTDIREGHKKTTHGRGAHARGHFAWKKNEYTGMFQQADNCIIRMANAAEPGTLAMSAYGPNLAVKCTRDGVEAANMQFLWQLDGYAVIPENTSKSCSYFEAPLCNHIPLRDTIAGALKDTFGPGFFAKADPHAMLVGVSQMASHQQDGSQVSKPHFPFALVLNPTPALNYVKCDFNNYTSQLQNLEAAGLASPGQVLYEVHAVREPPPEKGPSASSLQHIGSLVLDSPFSTSTFGDTELFFRHTFFQEELEILKALDADRALGWARYLIAEDGGKKEGASLYWPFLPPVAETSMVSTV
jgi:hypothetical protein